MRRPSVSPGARGRRAAIGTALLLAMGALAPAGASAATSGGWSNLGHGASATSAPLNERVLALRPVGSRLYVGGQFTNAGGIAAADRVAVWNGSTWAAVGAGLTNGSVNAIAVDGTNVYVGGAFVNAGGDANADNLAVWNGSAWHAVGGAAMTGPVWALAISGTKLIVGGGFDNANGIAEADAVAAYDLAGGGWSAITNNSGDVTGTVFALAPDGAGGAWVGGYFADVDGIATADYAAHWTGGTTWTDLGGIALDAPVRGLAASGTGVTLVGDFTNAGGIPQADKVARFDGSWSSVGPTAFFPEAGTSLYAVAIDGPRTIVAGNFLNAGGIAQADGVAYFTGTRWLNLGTNAAGTNGPATALRAAAVIGKRVFVGGLDTRIGGGAMNVCAASFLLRQPDGSIKATGSFVGSNRYNTTAASQAVSLSVARGHTGTFTIRIQNDGGVANSMLLKGPGSGAGFTATWRSGTTNITSQVVAGTYAINGLAHGATRTFTLTVRVGAAVHVGVGRSWLLTATSTGGGAPKDAVKATVRAR